MSRDEQQRQAETLHRAVADDLARHLPDAAVTLKGGGIHWDCLATRGPRTSKIHCFAGDDPEYLVHFREQDNQAAVGRTRALPHVVRATRDWLAGRPVAHLHACYLFVDRRRRELSALACEATARLTQLTRAATCELRPVYDSAELTFRAGDRACEISFYGRRVHPDAVFTWDDTGIFGMSVSDPRPFADLLARWLCDRAAPSAIAAEFRTVKMGELAPYYEEGRPLEGEFIVSWRHLEDFYRRLAEGSYPDLAAALAFIDQIRAAGLDKTLRAGQSLTAMIVSRSRRHGLRDGQPTVWFGIHRGGMTVESNFEPREKLTAPRPELTPEVHSLLKRLEAKPID